ncbi:hypothetical protein GW590_05020 [Rahnella sp. SAP-1]|uniref:Uncharacterized protein n=1 Tax=Rouxiella aceris TaxID=2703884 RepID=A0A848MIU3_9GAMM|nr:hypothetical protein [Rouxiella aceris]NMP26234.1 hypothetical protein [Rouxiella aceris]
MRTSNNPGFSTLVGTPKEVQTHLGTSQAGRVLAVSFDHIDDAATIQILVDNLSNMAAAMAEVFKERQEKQSLDRLADVLLPSYPVAPHIMKEAGMQTRARKAVLDSGNWLTALELAELADLSLTNPSVQPNKWKKAGQIFAIRHRGIDYFPDYGLDKNTHYRPLKVMAQIIEIFSGQKDGWGMAFWFMSVNSFLGGKRPQDLLAVEPERVIAAARDEVEGVLHG